MTEDEELLDNYKQSLAEDLKINSKAVISTLTMVASENISLARQISHLIIEFIKLQLSEKELKDKERMINYIYLMDSILKNVKGTYQALFENEIVELYSEVFDFCEGNKVNLKALANMRRIIDTWNGYFRSSTLEELKSKVDGYFNRIESKPLLPSSTATLNPLKSSLYPQEQTLKQKALSLLMPYLTLNVPQSQQVRQLYSSVVNASMVSGDQYRNIERYLKSIPPMPALGSIPTVPMYSNPAPVAMSLDLNTLNTLSSLINIKPSFPTTAGSYVGDTKKLNKKVYSDAVNSLYDDLPMQCSQCGRRFFDDDLGSAKYQKHLDWHFKLNAAAGSRNVSRDWFLIELQWIQFNSATDIGISEYKPSFENTDSTEDYPASKKKKSESCIPAIEKVKQCMICHEDFERFWNEDHEEWMYHDAVSVDFINGEETISGYFHEICYKDQESGFDIEVVQDFYRKLSN